MRRRPGAGIACSPGSGLGKFRSNPELLSLTPAVFDTRQTDLRLTTTTKPHLDVSDREFAPPGRSFLRSNHMRTWYSSELKA